jgi:hypothetical protein
VQQQTREAVQQKATIVHVDCVMLSTGRGCVAILAMWCVLQASWRARQARVAYQQQQEAAVLLQTLLRAAAARQLYASMLAAHRASAATCLQAAWRAASARQQYKAQRQAAVVLQSGWRAAAARQQYKQLRAAVILQSAWRAAAVQQQYRQMREAVASGEGGTPAVAKGAEACAASLDAGKSQWVGQESKHGLSMPSQHKHQRRLLWACMGWLASALMQAWGVFMYLSQIQLKAKNA